MKSKRDGNAYLWQMETDHSIVSGRTIDNLDTKDLSEAINKFEWAFILLREVALENESLCMDNEKDRLDLCQSFADRFRQEKSKMP